MTGMDVWLRLCMTFVALATAEYAILLYLKYHRRKQLAKIGMGEEFFDDEMRTRETSAKIDKIAFVIFFILFLIFNVIYWAFYLS